MDKKYFSSLYSFAEKDIDQLLFTGKNTTDML